MKNSGVWPLELACLMGLPCRFGSVFRAEFKVVFKCPSLNFHLFRVTLRRMLAHSLHIRGLARLMTVLFAAQIMVAGFCLLTSQAHAMPQSAQTQTMHAHCDMSNELADYSADVQHTEDHASTCYHCDQPDQLSSSNVSSAISMMAVLSDDVHLTATVLSNSSATGLLSARTPTGPPRSSSLLYSTSQRILI